MEYCGLLRMCNREQISTKPDVNVVMVSRVVCLLSNTLVSLCEGTV